MKYIRFLFILACFNIYHSLPADAVITFFLKPYPELPSQDECDQAAESLKKPGKIAEYCVFGFYDKKLVHGVFATYAGYLSVSNEIGQITFPQLQTKNLVKILITHRLTPIIMMGNTVHHWEIDKEAPAQLYSFTKEYNKRTKSYFWNVKEEKLPDNLRIATDTLVILAKPKHLYVPEGITLITQETANFTLPDIYVKKGINLHGHALYMLNLDYLYAPIHDLFKQQPARYIRLINV